MSPIRHSVSRASKARSVAFPRWHVRGLFLGSRGLVHATSLFFLPVSANPNQP